MNPPTTSRVSTREWLTDFLLHNKLPLHHDSQQTFAQVPRLLLQALGIEKHISPSSFQRDKDVFLDKEVDCYTFLEALKHHGLPKPDQYDASISTLSEIHGYDYFKPSFFNEGQAEYNIWQRDPIYGLANSLDAASSHMDELWAETLINLEAKIEEIDIRKTGQIPHYYHIYGTITEVFDKTITIESPLYGSFQLPTPKDLTRPIIGDPILFVLDNKSGNYNNLPILKNSEVIALSADDIDNFLVYESSTELKMRAGPYPSSLNHIFTTANKSMGEGHERNNIIEKLDENNLIHLIFRKPHEDPLTLHYALVRGAANCNYKTVEAFFQDIVHGTLEPKGEVTMNFDLNSYPDANTTLQAAYMGAYRRMDPHAAKASGCPPPTITKYTVKHIGVINPPPEDEERILKVVLTLSPQEAEGGKANMTLTGRRAHEFLSTGCKHNDIMETITFLDSNNPDPLKPEACPLYAIRNFNTYELRAIRFMNLPPQEQEDKQSSKTLLRVLTP